MKLRVATLGRFLLMAVAVFLVAPLEAEEKVTSFSPDAGHLWNRLYAALTPPGPTGMGMFGKEPAKETQRPVLALLAEFAGDSTKPGTMTPLQRAVMQRHLLMHFHAAVEREQQHAVERKTAAQAMMTALVPAIRKIALTSEEIRKLPDNYAAAVARADAVTTFDPKKPAPFLPKDLLADDEPWIALDLTPQGGRQGLAAEFHFKFFRQSTSFEVRMRHPEGRAAGEAYLKKLAEMPEPWLKEATHESRELAFRSEGPFPNPQTPQFPPGTAWALIHRAVLADSNGIPVVSPLVEGVQIRVYHNTLGSDELSENAEFKAEVAALDPQKKELGSVILLANRLHTAFEWTMTGTQPLENGGFHLSAPEDTIFSAEGRKEVPITVVCMQCHSTPGIHSVNTRSGFFHDGHMARPPEFQPATRAKLDEVTVAAAQKAEGWSQLRERWEK